MACPISTRGGGTLDGERARARVAPAELREKAREEERLLTVDMPARENVKWLREKERKERESERK